MTYWSTPAGREALAARHDDRMSLREPDGAYCQNCEKWVGPDYQIIDMGRGQTWNVCNPCLSAWSDR